ncbi:MAG: deaminase, partial [Methylocystis sp.]
TVISLGSNEVPKPGGGTYWPSDVDSRDFRRGYDPNELNKREVFADLIKRLLEDRFLSTELLDLNTPHLVVEKLLDSSEGTKYKESRVMDIIEYGRIIHAEMSAICDAARNGRSIKDGVLYSTTFPCHLCAKHIVASGIAEVVYLEPYPKSYALNLHSDSISLTDEMDKVRFRPFMGIAPTRYRDLFEKGKRKTREGRAMKWQSDKRRPSISYMFSPSSLAEPYVLVELSKLIHDRKQDV